jgi:hypothetical protein
MTGARDSFNCRFLHLVPRPQTDLVGRYEARSLDGETLRTIAAVLFGVTNLD